VEPHVTTSADRNAEIARFVIHVHSYTKLMKGKALRKHSMHEKTAAAVLLKLFISSNE